VAIQVGEDLGQLTDMTVCAYSHLNRGARYVFEHLERMASVAEYLIIKIKTYMIGSPSSSSHLRAGVWINWY